MFSFLINYIAKKIKTRILIMRVYLWTWKREKNEIKKRQQLTRKKKSNYNKQKNEKILINFAYH